MTAIPTPMPASAIGSSTARDPGVRRLGASWTKTCTIAPTPNPNSSADNVAEVTDTPMTAPARARAARSR